MKEVAALAVCSGGVIGGAVLEPEGELEVDPEGEEALDVPLVLEDETVYAGVSTM